MSEADYQKSRVIPGFVLSESPISSTPDLGPCPAASFQPQFPGVNLRSLHAFPGRFAFDTSQIAYRRDSMRKDCATQSLGRTKREAAAHTTTVPASTTI